MNNEKHAWAENMGRSMARADFQKTAYENTLASCAEGAGIELAKMGGLGEAALAFAKKNPGAAIGGGLGALHGLMNGGIGSAVTEGAVGAAAGHGIHSYGQQNGINSLETAKAHIDQLRKMGMDKEAFGALLQAAKSALPAAMNFIKANPLKAGIGAAQAVGNFASSRKNGEGLGSSLLSGAAGAASAL